MSVPDASPDPDDAIDADSADGAGPRRAPAVTRAAAILELLARTTGVALGPTDIARSLSMAKSSVSYVCEALVDAGLARRDGSGYQLGHRLVGLGAAYLDSVDTVSVFHAVCRELTPSIPETAQLSTLDRLDVTYLGRREGAAPVRLASDVGRRLVATTTATGKAMLAQLPWSEVAARLRAGSPLPALTARSITDPASLEAELAHIRTTGYAVDDEETLPGMFCIGRAIPSDDVRADLYGVSLTMLKSVADEARIARCRRDLDLIADAIAARAGLVVRPAGTAGR
jgi:DNA-binding IclR family transcriptional regulator